jgi:Arc/MetJ family transcription regulator
MNEEWIRTMAATHVDVDEALAEVPRMVHLAVRLAAVSNALAAEVRRLTAERDAALNLAEGYAPEDVRRLREQMAFDRAEGR